MLEFQFDDAFSFATKLAKAPAIVGEEMTRGVDRLTIAGEGFAKGLAPVKTGHLRRSITHKPATFGGGVARGEYGTATPYAKYVEFGRGPVVARGRALRFTVGGRTIYAKRVGPAAPRPFMRPSVARLRPLVQREFAGVTARIVARLGA